MIKFKGENIMNAKNLIGGIVDSYNTLLAEFNGDKVALNKYLERNDVAQYVIVIEVDYGMYEHNFKCKKGNLEKRKDQELKKFIRSLIKDGEMEKGQFFQYSCKEMKNYW